MRSSVRAMLNWSVVTAMVLSFGAPALRAQDTVRPRGPAGTRPVKPEIVKFTFTSPDGKSSWYVARPAGETPRPGLILVHEYWGLNDWVKQQAERFAEHGYVAVAPDLYRGEVAKDQEHAHELMRGLTDERAAGDLKAAFEWTTSRSFTKGKPIGVIGWCMGGGYALKLAIAEPRVACTVMCYGKPVT